MKDDKRTELAAIPIVLALLGVLFAIMLLAELGTWGWVLFGVACVVALVLVVVLLAEEVVRHAGDRRPEVLVVAPAAGSQLSAWTGDDAARDKAGGRLDATLRALEAAGVRARGEVGARDPIRAADDALRAFPADEVVFATHPESDADWVEDDVFEVARARYDVPVTHVVVDAG